jgi:YidC/Oxa1 family membrane protein insertase
MPLILLIPIITAVFQFFLSKMMLPANAPAKKGAKSSTDFQTAFQSQSMFIFPIMIGFFSFTFPVGLSLYWNTFTIFGILQQYLLVGAGGLTPWIKKIKNNG